MLRSRIAGVDSVDADSAHSFSRHTHEQFGIGVIRRGAHRSMSGRGMVEAGAGDTITVNPGEVHDGAPIGDAGRSWRILYFDPALIADAVSDLSQGKTSCAEFASPAIRIRHLGRQVDRLFSTATSGTDVDAGNRWEERLLTVLASVMREKVDAGRPRTIPASIGRARSIIDDDPAAPVTLADLAAASGLSRFQVLRGFVRATRLTPHAYLVQRRIDLARRLIAGGTAIAAAAAASGFADQSHMTRVFVRKYGLSPGAYADAVA
jgi:AraC-like DNA-binding protein